MNAVAFRGIVLKESLVGGLPPAARPYLIDSYPYRLDGEIEMTVLKLNVPSPAVTEVARALSAGLRRPGYFAQLTGPEEMIVVFPGRTVTVVRSDAASAEAAREIGATYDIPYRQMKFEGMFENDHPNLIDHQKERKR